MTDIIQKKYEIISQLTLAEGQMQTFIVVHSSDKGAKGDWDFRISDLVKNPDGADI